MAWKGVHISRPSRLNTADSQLVVAQDDGEVCIPLEDIAYIVLDAAHATLTSTLLSACMEAGIVIISTDRRHTPDGLMLPFHQHHRQAGVAAVQVALSEPFKKRCWQKIIVQKIENQARHLIITGRDGGALLAMGKRVGSGDPQNLEARAAREYWGQLFEGFIRDDPADLRNKLLNYGYAVARAGIARALVSYGLLPNFGVGHASVTNAFNLADDIFEPFRPLVDCLAYRLWQGRSREEELTIEDRRALAGVLMMDARVAGEKVSLLVATEKAAESFVRCMDHGTPALLALPTFVDEGFVS